VKVKRLEKAHFRSFEEQNQARLQVGLSEMKVIVRQCLSCGQFFESIDNRTCGCLKERSDTRILGWESDY